ncbi:MAG: hypothetical protein A2Y62_05975 [Candidatus Fischerbacteria bacterium RBG_13_37_8]|uniref:ArnR1-like winged helix-turn-helix domain-containing protein n=1 Tax=Candidatus Fischerbacteria bacterium RBG_13_37_8 TaxID=1817863 RepID=A0A1F5VX47_9BACT|nr:MAG: hypothetical protein A2Y62_05975 [Candidatus Fischerbacteria bacterium RBG_13_37_8]
MACINADGTLSGAGRFILSSIDKPITDLELSQKIGLPLFRIRMSIREFLDAGYISQDGDKYIITERGKAKI